MSGKKTSAYLEGITKDRIEANKPALRDEARIRMLFHPPDITSCPKRQLFFAYPDKLKAHLQANHPDWQPPRGHSWQRFGVYANAECWHFVDFDANDVAHKGQKTTKPANKLLKRVSAAAVCC